MERRTLLKTASTGLLLASLPPWLGTALANPDDTAAVVQAWAAAKAQGRPLLVLAIPSQDEHERAWRGIAIGALLYEGEDALLAALGDCTLVCATPRAIRAAFPEVPDTDTLLAVYAGPDGVRSSVAAALPAPPEAAPTSLRIGGWSLQEPSLAPYAPLLGKALRDVLGPLPDGPQVAARAQEVRAALGAAPPAGTEWVYFDPCPPCGMMQVDPPGRRFLRLLLDAPE